MRAVMTTAQAGYRRCAKPAGGAAVAGVDDIIAVAV